MAEEKPKQAPSLNLILIGLLVAASFVIGSLYTKVQVMEKGGLVKGEQVKDTAQAPSPQVPTFGSADNVERLKDDDHIRGDKNARMLLIEYSDFECPFCKRFHPTAQKIVDEYKGKVTWVYRHFPLDQLHSKARKEAEAAECAGELGGEEVFWKMTDKIYEVTPSNNGLDLETLPTLATEVGLDKAKFKTCLDSGKKASRVEADYQGGAKAGISGTPGNILLDVKSGKTKLIPGALPLDMLKAEIDKMLSG